MKIKTTFIDYPDNESLAVIAFFSGCEHNCKGCQSPELQKHLDFGKPITHVLSEIFQELYVNKTDKLVLSGGDPLHPYNFETTKHICSWLKKVHDVNICIYTGYDFNYIQNLNFRTFDFIKGGKYEENLKQVSEKTNDYIQFASSNQFLIDTNMNTLSKQGRYYFKN